MAPSHTLYPVLPLKSTVLFPHILMPVAVGRPQSVAAAEAALVLEEKMLVAAVQRDPQTQNPVLSDLYPTATLAVIKRVIQRQDNVLQLLLQGIERVDLQHAVATLPYLQVAVTSLPEPQENSPEATALFRNVQELVRKAVKHLDTIPEDMANLLINTAEPVKLAYLIATVLNIDTAQEMQLLTTDDLPALLQRIHEHLSREVQILELRQKIAGETQVELDKAQRDYVLRQQLRQIKKELGEDEEQDDTESLRQRLAETELPDEVRKELERELSRLQRLAPAAPDHQVLRSYIEFALELPWSATTTDQLDLVQAQRILNEDHFGLEDIKDRIIEHLAVMQLKPAAKSPILCFVGPPGVGKTSLGHSIARALGRRFERFSLGGVHDEAELRGHRRTYIGALPGRILQAIRRVGVCNPVLMLDEVDKLGRDFRGDPAAALLEILDPAQNHTFRDHYLDLPFDLSKVFFICTANALESIPGPLLDRLEIMTLAGYSEEEKLEIAQRYLVPRQVDNTGLTPAQLPLSEAALCTIIGRYTREAGVRQLERTIGQVARKIARRVAMQETLPTCLEAADLDELLGPEMYPWEEARQHVPAGVSAGLAVTPTGGDVLYIEAQLLPGGKGLTLTGQLGEVMRESAEIARDLLWAEAAQLDVDVKTFENNGMHVHVPAGAIPKDGPSAGIALATAMASLVTRKPVRSDTAMTGELTLAGLVLPVGGIKEKILAARRAGLHRVILPKANAKDLRKLPDAVRDAMEFILAERFVEVIQHAIPDLDLLDVTTAVGV
ncbi:MAG: endopeptidase La [Candidatus Tectomicrobia bacterium]|uniref:Lon protease n=1 Tax=Tectimicrobiota bacterium TaxID=2528274 RepID=A0A938B1B1_UNCTE|nr:endopeptidase La [Candidatus Tectomicrobia bacterium]